MFQIKIVRFKKIYLLTILLIWSWINVARSKLYRFFLFFGNYVSILYRIMKINWYKENIITCRAEKLMELIKIHTWNLSFSACSGWRTFQHVSIFFWILYIKSVRQKFLPNRYLYTWIYIWFYKQFIVFVSCIKSCVSAKFVHDKP